MCPSDPVGDLPHLNELSRGARQIAENLQRIDAALPLAPLAPLPPVTSQPPVTGQPGESAAPRAAIPAPHHASAPADSVTTGGRGDDQGQASS